MTTFILLFVAVQLGAGFLALIVAMQSPREGYEDESGFHYSGAVAATRRPSLRQPDFRTSVLVLAAKASA